MADWNAILAVLANNRADIEQVVNQIGIANLVKAAPALTRIAQTISKASDPVAAATQAERTVFYGAATAERVRVFQKAHGLVPDGIVGNETWATVERLLGKST